ncbi:MAG TPA: dihydrofolate reductase [Candidatus Avamphibacillus sp.]|nr:dihydrofolate reductase [Candidatus Avamphibacillus sp.]
MISLLVAMDTNHVIGFNNGMPWHLPKDLQYFKEKTTGHTIIMGRKTFDSIGRVLPNRKHIVITRNKELTLPDEVKIIYDVNEIKQLDKNNPKEEFFVIGGGGIFLQILPYADRMYITLIDQTFEGDVYFPEFSKEEWILTSKAKGDKDDKNPYDYYFLQYDRKR